MNVTLFEHALRSPLDVLKDLHDPSEHLELFSSGKHDDKFMYLFAGQDTIAFDAIPKYSGDIPKRIMASGLELYVADLTSRAIIECAPDVSVVKVIAPALVPMHFGKNWFRTGSVRIFTVPEICKWKTFCGGPNDPQTFPYPFP